MLIHQDNAPAHLAALVQRFLLNTNFEVVPHAPYSPDLAPGDVWVFTNAKGHSPWSHIFH